MNRSTYNDRSPSDRRLPYNGRYRAYDNYINRYRNRDFSSPLSYGPSRRSEYPWIRDESFRRLHNTADRTGERSHDTIEESRTEDNEVEVNKHFHVLEVDLNIEKNTKQHHTNTFMCTKRKDNPSLVIRRGQAFVISITFDREYHEEQNEISFFFKTGKNQAPPKRTAATVPMDEKPNGSGVSNEWFAKLINKKDKSIDVEIVPPSNCIIGEWMFDIKTESKIKDGGDVLTLEYKHNDDIIILLNPWCKDDQVYIATEELLAEYILNESGALFSGNYRQRAIKPWNFGQCKDGILNICLHLIRKAFNNTVDPGMGDAVKLARAIAKMVNAADDNGVLIGNWSGDYTGGTPPMKWVGSVAILEEYEKNNGDPVKFGQCWVFSALTTTICRAIGLPARSVTNFASAHDTDGTTAIDRAYVKDGDKWEKVDIPGSSDSIWNFHVWNEVWMSRAIDLGNGYDGWQVIDATPQEISEGQYRCGPAPVIAIKKGDIGKVQYDAPFIFAEVNADIVEWGIMPNNEWVIIDTDPNDVGKCISTKIPDGKPYNGETSIYWGDGENYRLDITNEYKYPEGTLEERLAVQNANRAVKGDRDVFFSKKEDVSVEIVEKDGVLVGNDFEVEVIVKNINKTKAKRTIKHLQIVVDAVKYTQNERRNVVTKRFKDIRIGFEEEKRVKFSVNTDEYWDKMYDLFNMEIMVFAYVEETENYYLKRDDYRLRRPDISIKAPGNVKVRVPFEVELSFKNSLPKPLTNCSLLVEGNGLENVSRKESDVPSKSEWSSTVKLEAEKDGDIQINASFACDELKDIVGLVAVTSTL